MSNENGSMSRRGFLKAAGIAGAGSVLGAGRLLAATSQPASAASEDASKHAELPTRAFGKTGVKVPILALGGIFDTINNQLVFKQAVKWGVTYWDTAESYDHGKSEEGMGNFLGANSDARKKIFLVSKTDNFKPETMSDNLGKSLERLKTDYVDMYFVHGVSNPSRLDDGIKDWAEKAKKSGKIKFFGFSTHSNVEQCLSGAAKLGWIDGIMTRYSYQVAEEMKAPIEECQKAGVGLTAMKTIATRSSRRGPEVSEAETAVFQRFVDKGFSPQQACLKAVWDNPGIATICSQMPDLTKLSANLAAAMDKRALSDEDKKVLAMHAAQACGGYCAGCTSICEKAVAGSPPIGDVMRCLMYYHGYQEPLRAREVFQQLPRDLRDRLGSLDYSQAEKLCPRGMAIADLMKEACQLLA